jgi:hypothetical protein
VGDNNSNIHTYEHHARGSDCNKGKENAASGIGKLEEKNVRTIKNKLNGIFHNSIVGLCLNNIIAFVFDESLGSKILGARFKRILNDLSYELELNEGENLAIALDL